MDLESAGYLPLDILYFIVACDEEGNVGLDVSGPKVFTTIGELNIHLGFVPQEWVAQTFVLKLELRTGSLYKMNHVYTFKHDKAKGEFDHFVEVLDSEDCTAYVMDGSLIGFNITDDFMLT